MHKNNKKIDTAELNKQNYIREQYIVKEENAYNVTSVKHRILIAALLAVLLLSLSALLYWSTFMMPKKNQFTLSSTDIVPQNTLSPDENSPGLSAFVEKYGETTTAMSILDK